MVGIGYQNPSTNMEKREEVLKLMTEKQKIETDIRSFSEILSLNNIGMNDPLVDSEGYPRNDIDVYQVRTARHRIICLRNDYKNIMLKIEAGLHDLHSSSPMDCDDEETEKNNQPVEVPFARVNLVSPGSPADICGLRAGDVLVEFGSVNKSNFTAMKDIARVVDHSVGSAVHVRVKRPDRHSSLSLELIPQAWNGRGLLGCEIDPLPSEPVER